MCLNISKAYAKLGLFSNLLNFLLFFIHNVCVLNEAV